MKRTTHVKILFLMMMIALLINSAYAAPVTSLPGGTVIPMPSANYFGAGPQSFGSGITWTSTYGYSVFGYTSYYGYLENGNWNGNLGPMAGLNDPTGTMTFAFSTPISGVGGFINHIPSYSTSTAPTTIAVYDSQMHLIESNTLTFNTGGGVNSGEFHGFLETSPEISYFALSNNYIGITTLTTKTTNGEIPAPEFPSAVLPVTMIIGFLGAVLYIQRTREQ